MIHIYIRRLQSRVQVFSMLKKLWKSNRSIRLFKILFKCTNLLIEKKNPGNKATFLRYLIQRNLKAMAYIRNLSIFQNGFNDEILQVVFYQKFNILFYNFVKSKNFLQVISFLQFHNLKKKSFLSPNTFTQKTELFLKEKYCGKFIII